VTGGGIGGQAAKRARIENYLGFPHGISGDHLTRLALAVAPGEDRRLTRRMA
jgi:thioredoxin reductase